MRAQKQGDLDGLCGLYAIVNAIELTGVVGPKSTFHRRLFKRLLNGLAEGELHQAMIDDVPLSFHPAATRVLGLVTPRSVG